MNTCECGRGIENPHEAMCNVCANYWEVCAAYDREDAAELAYFDSLPRE